jgi:hypothetical protein
VSTFEKAGEVVARGIDRRRLLKRSAASIFGVVAAWAVEGIRPPSALARSCTSVSSSCACQPIGEFCNTIKEEWCKKGACSGACRFYDEIYEPTGCWCTRDCCYRDANNRRVCGYYKCCDCKCPRGTSCSCKHFVKTYPATRT